MLLNSIIALSECQWDHDPRDILVIAAIAAGKHPDSFRTRKLSRFT